MLKPMHLTGFMAHTPASHTQMSWVYPQEKALHQWHEVEYWQSIARTLERGKFDMFFFADQFAAYEAFEGSMERTLRYATQFPVHDPVVLIPALAAVTKKLGFAATMSVTYYPPFLLARKLSTLDHLTKGRIGWNIVTSYHTNEAKNFGLDTMFSHDERYARAEEYMNVCNALWGSWDDDAVVMDMENGIFADPAKVRTINFRGKWFNCRGPASVIPSPQRRPLLIQAGASGPGRDFAARHAECIFGVQLTEDNMAAFAKDVRSRAVRMGRAPGDLKILWGAMPIVAKTEAEARDIQREAHERIPLEAGLTLMSGHLNFDLSTLDLDAPMDNIEVPGIQGVLTMFADKDGNMPTLREAGIRYGAGLAMPQLVGTPSQVADQLVQLHRNGGGDGFQFSPIYYGPQFFDDIVDLLIPELQSRGVFREDYSDDTLRKRMNE